MGFRPGRPLTFGGLTTYWLLRPIGRLFQAAWLQGTLLIVRDSRVFAVDLAAARWMSVQPSSEPLAAPASVGVGGPPLMVPLLIVNSNGPELRLRLASRERVLLPPEQLFLLANALSAARCPGAAETVAWLRTTAASIQASSGNPYTPSAGAVRGRPYP